MVASVLVRVDKETHDRFKKLSGESPVAAYLRELSKNLCEETPVSPIEKKLDEILKNQKILINYHKLFRLSYQNKAGEFVESPSYYVNKAGEVVSGRDPTLEEMYRAANVKVPETDAEEAENLPKIEAIFNKYVGSYLTQLEAISLAQYDEEHPEGEGDEGLYHRDASGKWHLVKERVEEANRREPNPSYDWKKGLR